MIRALALATATLIAAVVIILAASAAYDIRWNPGDALTLAIAAMFLPWALLFAYVHGRRHR